MTKNIGWDDKFEERIKREIKSLLYDECEEKNIPYDFFYDSKIINEAIDKIAHRITMIKFDLKGQEEVK